MYFAPGSNFGMLSYVFQFSVSHPISQKQINESLKSVGKQNNQSISIHFTQTTGCEDELEIGLFS
jgi:hypothetical protein